MATNSLNSLVALVTKQQPEIQKEPDVFRFDKAGNRLILTSDSKRDPIDCPDQKEGIGVLIAFGQSNIANSAQYRVTSNEVPDVINWHKGRCYEARSPLLGSSNSRNGGEGKSYRSITG